MWKQAATRHSRWKPSWQKRALQEWFSLINKALHRSMFSQYHHVYLLQMHNFNQSNSRWICPSVHKHFLLCFKNFFFLNREDVLYFPHIITLLCFETIVLEVYVRFVFLQEPSDCIFCCFQEKIFFSIFL